MHKQISTAYVIVKSKKDIADTENTRRIKEEYGMNEQKTKKTLHVGGENTPYKYYALALVTNKNVGE